MLVLAILTALNLLPALPHTHTRHVPFRNWIFIQRGKHTHSMHSMHSHAFDFTDCNKYQTTNTNKTKRKYSNLFVMIIHWLPYAHTQVNINDDVGYVMSATHTFDISCIIYWYIENNLISTIEMHFPYHHSQTTWTGICICMPSLCIYRHSWAKEHTSTKCAHYNFPFVR